MSPQTWSFETFKAEVAHEMTCQRWPHRALRHIQINRMSRWNAVTRKAAWRLCPIDGGRRCR